MIGETASCAATALTVVAGCLVLAFALPLSSVISGAVAYAVRRAVRPGTT